jgi:hypothetical protein
MIVLLLGIFRQAMLNSAAVLMSHGSLSSP